MSDAATPTPAPTPSRPARQGPLVGIRVVELAGIGPAPFAASMLADLGAEVVRVERPGGVSPLATSDGMSRSRPNLAVDLKNPDGLAVVRRLVEGADVLIEGLRPGVTERLGLGPEAFAESNPGLVYARMTGWGQTGPWASMAGHDITYAALSGTLHTSGTAEKPMAPVNYLADFGGGALYLVVGVLAALTARSRTGKGQVVDAAMVDGAAHLATMVHGLYAGGQWRDHRQANLLDGAAPFYDTYRCADGKWVAVGALEPQFWALLNSTLGLDFAVPQMDPSGWAEQRAAYEQAFATRSRDEWAEVFDGTDACVAPVLSLAEAPHHPHLVARGTFVEVGGAGSPVAPAVAPTFSGTPAGEPTPADSVGGSTVSVLLAAGLSQDEVDALLASGAVVQA